jgi:hypothetical protein
MLSRVLHRKPAYTETRITHVFKKNNKIGRWKKKEAIRTYYIGCGYTAI